MRTISATKLSAWRRRLAQSSLLTRLAKSDALQWITVGGGEAGGKKHVGGTPVLIDAKGVIQGGPKALHGRALKHLDKNVAGTKKDQRRQSGLSKKDRESIRQRFDAGEHVDRIGADHGISGKRVRQIAERAQASTPDRQRANLRAIAREVAGSRKEDQDGFIELVQDLHREKVQGIEEYNQQLKDFFGAQTRQAASLRGTIQLVKNRGGDATHIKGFDQVVDYARRYYPALLHVPGEPGHDEESALMHNIARGRRELPPLDDDEVLSEAIEYAQSFRNSSKTEEHDYVPFSLLALRRRIAADVRRAFTGRLSRPEMIRFAQYAERQTRSPRPIFARMSAICTPLDRYRLAVTLGLVRFAAARAPKGGVNIDGKFYPGGKFIPGKSQAEVNAAAKKQDRQKSLFDDGGEAQTAKPNAVPKPKGESKPVPPAVAGRPDPSAVEFVNAANGRRARAVHAMLDRPEIMDRQSVDLAFQLVGPGQHEALAAAISAKRPDLADAVNRAHKSDAPEVRPPAPPDGAPATPRQEAASETKRLVDDDYIYARKSAVPNAGEDLLGSARHKINAWRGLEQAEKDGVAATLVNRAQLEKNEPHNLLATVDEQPHSALSSLAMHFALKSFPPKPGYGKRYRPDEEQAKKDRRQYLEAYQRLKAKAESLARSESDPQQALLAIREEALTLIKEFRGQTGHDYLASVTAADRYNATANALVGMVNALKVGGYGRPKKNSAMGRMLEFSAALQESGLELRKENWGQVAERIKDVIEHDSISKAFGKKGQSKPRGFTPADLYVNKAERKGGRKLDAKTANAAVTHLTDNMKMRGVQWGNSVTDDERQHHATRATEAMMDLADVLGLEDEDMSLGGHLGFAIGARGKGNALAHYEPGSRVINLTRKGGVGSLAHEWGHFFDHAMAGFGTSADNLRGRSDADYHSERTSPTRFVKNEDGSYKVAGKKLVTEDFSQDPIWKGFDGIRKAVKETGFEKRLGGVLRDMVNQGLMSKSKREYWRSTREVFARTFERYVQHKLREQGRENTYLSGFGADAHWSGDPRQASGAQLWPTDAETAQMAPAFDALFAAYKERRAKQATGMASRWRAPRRSRLAVAHAPKGGVSIDGRRYPGGSFIPGKTQAEVNRSASRQKTLTFVDDESQLADAKQSHAAALQKIKESLATTGDVEAKIADWKQHRVRSQAFKSWFGDWEVDPKNASKVVNPETGEPQETHGVSGKASKVLRDGKPVVVYHGTAKGGFEAFEKSKLANPEELLYGPGFYFTEDQGVADSYRSKGAEQRYAVDLTRDAAERMAAIMDKRGWTDHFAGGFYGDLKTALRGDDARWTLKHAADWLAGQAARGDEDAKQLIQASGLELVDNRAKAETKAVYLNIRNPFDVDGPAPDSSTFATIAKAIKKENPVLAKIFVKKAQEGTSYPSAGVLYNVLAQELGKSRANDLLIMLGHDGITHIGGRIQGDREHRVWIAFEPNQIKAVNNRGTFDPNDNRMRMARLAWRRRVSRGRAAVWVRLAADDWSQYKGPRGGKGWRNTKTGRIVYGDRPAGRGKSKKPTDTPKIREQKENLRRNLRRAPKGGAWVGEKYYRGGQIVSKSAEFTAYGKDRQGKAPESGAVATRVKGAKRPPAEKPEKSQKAKAKKAASKPKNEAATVADVWSRLMKKGDIDPAKVYDEVTRAGHAQTEAVRSRVLAAAKESQQIREERLSQAQGLVQKRDALRREFEEVKALLEKDPQNGKAIMRILRVSDEKQKVDIEIGDITDEREIARQIKAQIRESLHADNPIAAIFAEFGGFPTFGQAKFTDPDKAVAARFQRVLDELSLVVSDIHAPVQNFAKHLQIGVFADDSPKKRAFASGAKQMALAKYDGEDTVWHEFGHLLEHSNPQAKLLIREFRDRRKANSPVKNLQELFPDTKYEADEVGFRDDFGFMEEIIGSPSSSWYTGKVYRHDSTEILSMGVQALARDPARFAEADPEYFNLVVGILHGHLLTQRAVA